MGEEDRASGGGGGELQNKLECYCTNGPQLLNCDFQSEYRSTSMELANKEDTDIIQISAGGHSHLNAYNIST